MNVTKFHGFTVTDNSGTTKIRKFESCQERASINQMLEHVKPFIGSGQYTCEVTVIKAAAFVNLRLFLYHDSIDVSEFKDDPMRLQEGHPILLVHTSPNPDHAIDLNKVQAHAGLDKDENWISGATPHDLLDLPIPELVDMYRPEGHQDHRLSEINIVNHLDLAEAWQFVWGGIEPTVSADATIIGFGWL